MKETKDSDTGNTTLDYKRERGFLFLFSGVWFI